MHYTYAKSIQVIGNGFVYYLISEGSHSMCRMEFCEDELCHGNISRQGNNENVMLLMQFAFSPINYITLNSS